MYTWGVHQCWCIYLVTVSSVFMDLHSNNIQPIDVFTWYSNKCYKTQGQWISVVEWESRRLTCCTCQFDVLSYTLLDLLSSHPLCWMTHGANEQESLMESLSPRGMRPVKGHSSGALMWASGEIISSSPHGHGPLRRNWSDVTGRLKIQKDKVGVQS